MTIDEEELKKYIEAGYCDGYEEGKKVGYNKAIDDVETRILGNCSAMLKDGERVIVIRMDILKFILEQLKDSERKGLK